MKRFEGESYDTIAVKGHHRLAVNGETLESVRADIDKSNTRAIEKGYKAEQWIIIHKEWYTCYDDDGNFMASEEHCHAVEVYPPVI